MLAELLAYLKVPTVLTGGFTFSALFGMILALLFVLGFMALRGPGLKYKLTAILLVPLIVATTALALVEQLSYPKELARAWLHTQGEAGVAVHYAIVQPPKKVDLWIDLDGQPRAFWLPWTKELEKSLQAALEQSQSGRNGQLRFRFEPSLEQTPQFYSLPWPAPPPKDEESPAKKPFRFQQET
jgi:hypothetical protein